MARAVAATRGLHALFALTCWVLHVGARRRLAPTSSLPSPPLSTDWERPVRSCKKRDEPSTMLTGPHIGLQTLGRTQKTARERLQTFHSRGVTR